MNLKLEVKLRKLLKICPQLRLRNYLLKMKEPQVTDVCKVTTMKIIFFYETMVVVQVQVGIFEVLLDGRFDVNISLESLRKKLRLRKPQPTMFVIKMVDQRKVQPLIRNLKIDLGAYVYKISIIILNLENGIETYSMLMGRPWLKQAKAHHKLG